MAKILTQRVSIDQWPHASGFSRALTDLVATELAKNYTWGAFVGTGRRAMATFVRASAGMWRHSWD